MKENPNAGVINDDEDFIEYDEEGNAIMPERKVQNPTILHQSVQIK